MKSCSLNLETKRTRAKVVEENGEGKWAKEKKKEKKEILLLPGNISYFLFLQRQISLEKTPTAPRQNFNLSCKLIVKCLPFSRIQKGVGISRWLAARTTHKFV